jgi:hypothetical protein
MRAACLAVLAASGCSSILGIHPLSDADTTQPGDAKLDGTMITDDGPRTDAPPDGAAFNYIGEQNQLGSMSPISANFIIARSFSVGGQTLIVAAGAHLKTETNNGKIKFAIYNDNANSPYTLRVSSSSDITLDGNPGLSEGPLGPHTLPAGNYWMVIATDSNLEIGALDTNNVTGAAASLPYSSAFPAQYSPQPTSSAILDRINLYLKAQP